MAFFAKSSVHAGRASRRTVSSWTSLTVAYMPPIVRTPVPGCISLRICAAWRCFFLADRVIRNMAPMSTMNGRRVTRFTGRNFLRTTALVSGLVYGGGVRRPTRAASAESKRVRTHGTTPSMAPGFLTRRVPARAVTPRTGPVVRFRPLRPARAA